MYLSKASLTTCLFLIFSTNLLSPSAAQPHRHRTAEETTKTDFDHNSHSHDDPLSFSHEKTSLVPKVATIPGTPTWRVRYVKIASVLPLQVVAQILEVFLTSVLEQFQQTPDSAISGAMAVGQFRIRRGLFHLNFFDHERQAQQGVYPRRAAGVVGEHKAGLGHVSQQRVEGYDGGVLRCGLLVRWEMGLGPLD